MELTCVEYRALSGVFQNNYIDPPPPLPLASVSSPRTQGGGVHTRRAVRGVGAGRSIFWKTPDIGLASYSIIPLRSGFSDSACYIFLVGVKVEVQLTWRRGWPASWRNSSWRTQSPAADPGRSGQPVNYLNFFL